MPLFVLALRVLCFLCLPTHAEDSTLAPIRVLAERPPGHPSHFASEFQGSGLSIDTRGESSLVRVLSRQASVFAQRSGGDDSHVTFQLRGQDPHQTRFFLESVPWTDAQFHSAQLGWFPIEAVQTVDVFPEGTPATLAADGLGGAVLLRLAPPETARSGFGVRLGSFGSQRVMGKAPVGKSRILIEAAQTREDFPYWNNAGTPLIAADDFWAVRDHNGQRWASVLPQIPLWRGTHSTGDYFSFHTLRANQIPGPVGVPLRGDLTTQFHLAAVTAKAANGSWEVAGYGSALDQRFETLQLTAMQITHSLALTAGVRASLKSASAQGGWEATFGFAGDKADLESATNAIRATRVTVPLGVSAYWTPSETWTLKAGTLAQISSYAGTVERRSFALSPRLGAQWALSSRQRVRASVGRFFRAPSLSELHGSPSSVVPNARLQDESAWKAEAGWDARWREIQTSLTLSAAFADDLIVLVPNSQFSLVALNQGRSQILTSELGLDWSLAEQWKVRANAAFLSTRNDSQVAAYRGKDLPMRPHYRGGVETEWSRGPWRVSYGLQATGPFYSDASGVERVPEVWEHSVWASWQSRDFGMWLLELRNLTDATSVVGKDWNFYSNLNTTGLSGFPSPGRRVYFSWRCEI